MQALFQTQIPKIFKPEDFDAGVIDADVLAQRLAVDSVEVRAIPVNALIVCAVIRHLGQQYELVFDTSSSKLGWTQCIFDDGDIISSVGQGQETVLTLTEHGLLQQWSQRFGIDTTREHPDVTLNFSMH